MMKKILSALLILVLINLFIVFIYSLEINQNAEIQAAGNYFPTVSYQQYSKLQFSSNESYTALNDSGSFLSDKNIGNSPVSFETEVTPVVDGRNNSFISQTKKPSYSDIQSSVNDNHLNNLIPNTERWWLNDTAKIYLKDETAPDSARIVNKSNNLNDVEYVSPTYNSMKWNGYLPIVAIETYTEKLHDADTVIAYNSISGTLYNYTTAKPTNQTTITIPLCQAKIKDNVIQECDSENNPQIDFYWEPGYGFLFGTATMNAADRSITVTDTKIVTTGDLILVGELKWTPFDENVPWPPLTQNKTHPPGFSLMVVGKAADGTDVSITPDRPLQNPPVRNVDDFKESHGIANAGKYQGTFTGTVNVEPQKAFIRPMIQINSSQLIYISKLTDPITVNTFEPITAAMSANTEYIPHVLDSSLYITRLREGESGQVKIDASTNTIKIPQGTNTITLPVNTSSLNTGYERYISVLGDSISNQKIYGKIAKINDDNGTITFDISSFINSNVKGQKVLQLYAEDISNEGTSYISNPFNVTFEIVEPFRIDVDTNNDLEYIKNVNHGDIVAAFQGKNALVPMTYSIVSDTSVNGHGNDYQLFSLSNGNIIVNNINGLNAGDYYFKIRGTDGSDAIDSNTVHVVVNKTSLAVAFDDPSQTKKSISDAATAWSETATATPGSGTKITYAITGGDFGLIDIDANTGNVCYKGNGDYGKVTITATADDDPASGNDNYNPASVEKDIIIYKEVEGVVTPASGSGDNAIPTFTANQANVQANGKIAKITGMPGSPTPIDGNSYKYTYGITSGGNASFFAVDANTGDITTKGRLSIGEYHFNVTVSDGWSTKEIAVTVKVEEANAEPLYFYETSAAINMITRKSVVLTEENVVVYATVKGSSNPNPVKYRIRDGSTDVIEVNETSGAVTIHGVGTATIVAEKQGISGQADAYAELTFTVTAGAQNFIYTDNGGNELPKSGTIYNAYQEVYEPRKTFQLYTAGNPPGSTVTYQLKTGSPTDVISVDANGLVTVLNASISPSQIGRVIVEATSHDPTGNYSDKTIELPINITKAKQTISFKETTYVSNGKGSVAPIINEQDISSNEGGVSIPDTSYYISVDTSITNNIAYTNDGITIHYDYTGEDGIDIPLHVVKAGNRNYEKAEADGMLHIMIPDENILATTNMGKIVYGDHFEIRSLQDDSSSTNVQYQFEVDNTTYISNPTVSGNKAEFDALKVSGKTNITIKVTRTADGETPLSKNISVQVLPKEIEIVIDDQEKLKGEQNPTLTYQEFRNQLVSWNGVQDSIQENDIKLSTTAKTDSNAGSYPIKGDSNTLNKTYPNYSFSFKEGTMTIKEENIEDNWYHLEIDDGNNTAYTNSWTNQNVNIISDHPEYINLSLDQSTWKPTKVTVSKEGETNQSFWMKKDSGAITKEKQETIRIDKTASKVKGIKAKDTNNKLQDIINKLSGGIFFNPGTAFEISTDDSNADLKVSGTKEIAYKVYKIEQQARSADELIKEGKLTVTNEKASITISETTGSYKVCVTPTDNAGNTNTESCHEIELKKINVDVDNDGKPDFNDPNGDGCPDLNIKWKDPNDPSKWIVINGDRDYDGIPDLNIDSDGDGKADLNIDTDNDGKPDLNLVILKKADWKPTKCVKANIDNGILEEYCTGTSVKAVINVDIDGDRIPDINIDTNGDMKADINVDTNGDQIANTNLSPINVWKPDKNHTYQKFQYDTMQIDPLLNIDSDGDGRPDINVDLDDDGNADINIDVDGDGIPDTNIDGDGDGKPDINIDKDGDGKPDENIKEITEWKPEQNVDGEFPYDTMTFDEPTEPNEPKKPTTPNEQGNNTDVKGYYFPGNSIGGAITGDETKLMHHVSLVILMGGVIVYLYYRYYKNIM